MAYVDTFCDAGSLVVQKKSNKTTIKRYTGMSGFLIK